MQELDIATIKKRSIHGIFALVSQTFIIKLISVIVNFLLTIKLSPSVFGIYFIVTSIVAFLSYFSDIGLAAALIQKKEELTEDDLKTTFTIQQILVVTAVLIALAASGLFGKFYHLNATGVHLFQALVISFFISSLKTIPSILLERKLLFSKLVIPQIVETLIYNAVVLALVYMGYGITSFTVGVLMRGASGLVVIYIISPWKMRFGIVKDTAKRLLSFGVPFQANSFLALLKDDLLVAYIGKVLPLTQVGFVGFAEQYALQPLSLIMDNIIRITFPTFSRLTHDEVYLGKAVEKTLYIVSLVIFPALVGLCLLLPYLFTIIPRYHKWDPAYISFIFFSINAALSAISTPLTNVLNAIGKVKTTLQLMIFWVVSTWILTPLLIHFMGYNGVAIASALIAVSVVGVVMIAKKYISFSIFRAIQSPLLGTIVMGILIFFLKTFIHPSIPGLIIIVILAGVSYVGTMYGVDKQLLLENISLVRQNLKK